MEEKAVEKKSSSKNTGMAIVAYILFFVPLLTDAKNDPFVKFHVKQGLVVFLLGVVVSIFNRLLPSFWGLGIITRMLLLMVDLLSLGVFILVVIGIVNASRGEEKPLPLVGKFAEQFKI